MHQAIEKLLKGRIIATGNSFPYIHDLERLYKILLEKDPHSQGIEKEIILLQSYYLETRYPQAEFLDQNDLKNASSVFKTILKKLEK